MIQFTKKHCNSMSSTLDQTVQLMVPKVGIYNHNHIIRNAIVLKSPLDVCELSSYAVSNTRTKVPSAINLKTSSYMFSIVCMTNTNVRTHHGLSFEPMHQLMPKDYENFYEFKDCGQSEQNDFNFLLPGKHYGMCTDPRKSNHVDFYLDSSNDLIFLVSWGQGYKMQINSITLCHIELKEQCFKMMNKIMAEKFKNVKCSHKKK